jgi:hypothetical protein
VGRTCSEHKGWEHKGAFLNTAVLFTEGARVSLGAVQMRARRESGD